MLTIDWATKVINVPKSYTTLVTLTPFELRELDLDQFRLDLKALEYGVDGMPNERTHNHNTEVTVGGVTLARVIEIINGYTVTFENGSYAVNLVGANSNVADVTNLNTVQIRSANSAGLTSPPVVSVSGVTVTADTESIAVAVWDKLIADHQNSGSFGLLLQDLMTKADQIQHTGNLNTELLKNKPNNPNP